MNDKDIINRLEYDKYYINKIYNKLIIHTPYIQIKTLKLEKIFIDVNKYIKNYISYFNNGVFPKKQMVNEHNYICNKEELIRVFIIRNLNNNKNKSYIDMLKIFDTAILILTEFVKSRLIELFG